MDLRNVRYFIAVAENGSITEASNALRISQPPLSMAMAKLEKELGVTLFDRKPRGIELTAAGEYLHHAGRRLLAEERRISDTLKSMGQGLAGELHLGCEPMCLWRIGSTKISQFLSIYRNVTLDLTDANPRVQLDRLADGTLDLAIMPIVAEEPLQAVNGVHFDVTVVDELPLTLIAPKAWGLDESEPLDVASLKDSTWILPARIPGVRILWRIWADKFAPSGAAPTEVIQVPTVMTAAQLVGAGVGVSLSSLEMARLHPDVAQVPVVGGWPNVPIAIVRRKEGIVTPIAERFVELFQGD
ncbi:DNA-binding transcriptional LysR family regulator [Paenarthrobacter nicotinovorans]|uniref:LysR family transcriptional regulator n=1 Tax=Micrococcaceae TaxID=1268 RepID=UPI00087613E3|nr:MULTISPECIES: LysR family transcriptional regulator [Micrococcaceae]MDR6436607.1 DNA-binding transcriptional LysR family regulator [Paenarthrobacter nicotinovorans]SCZ57158.1 DNA-binding transcriptional regulator, LysR family [Arthrobacter sp. UNCCL28]